MFKYKDFKFVTMIGKGGGGEVWSVKDKEGVFHVVKILENSNCAQTEYLKELQNLILS